MTEAIVTNNEDPKVFCHKLIMDFETTRKNLVNSIASMNEELYIISKLIDYIKRYLLLDDHTDYATEDAFSTYCLLIGRLEMSYARRVKMVAEEQVELAKLKEKENAE